MRRILCAAAIVSATVLLTTTSGCGKVPPPAAPAGPSDMQAGSEETDAKKIVVARVNGTTITMHALVNMMNRLGPRPDTDQGNAVQKAKKAALDQLILQELAYQQAKARDIVVEPQLDAAVSSFKENMGGEEEYRTFLAQKQMTETELRTALERSLSLERIFGIEVAEKTIVPEELLKQEYEREKHRYVLPEKLLVTDVFFVKRTDAKTSLKKAKLIQKKILSDPARDPWKLVLDGTFLVRSLELNRERHPELYREAKKMKPGQLSGVINADDGAHIFTLTTASPARQLSFDETKESLASKFRAAAQKKRMQEWESELKHGASIEIIDQELQKMEAAGSGGK